MKTFIKSKSGPNAAGPKYRTSDYFKGEKFAAAKPPQAKFNPSQFRTQHKGG